jgi:hypothetical protein
VTAGCQKAHHHRFEHDASVLHVAQGRVVKLQEECDVASCTASIRLAHAHASTGSTSDHDEAFAFEDPERFSQG